MDLKITGKSLSKRQTIILGVLMLVVSLALLFWVNFTFINQLNPPATDDFKVFWSGTRTVVLGANPYDNSFGSIYNQFRGVTGDNPNYYFLSPIYLTLLFMPFAALPLNVAAALWTLVNEMLLGFTVVMVIKGTGIEPTTKKFLAGIALGLLLRYTFLVIMIGNLTLLLLCAIVASWYCTLNQRPYLAGATASLLLIKPQVAFLIIPLLLVLPIAGGKNEPPSWNNPASLRRLIGFGLVALIFLSYSFAVLPGWIGQMVDALFGSSQAYFNNQDINSQLTSLRSVVAAFVPNPSLVQPVAILIALPLWLGALRLWWRFRNDPTAAPFLLALIIGLNILTCPYIRDYDSGMLLFGLLFCFFTLQGCERMKVYRGKWSWLCWGLALLPFPVHFLAVGTSYAVENLITLCYMLLVALTWATSRRQTLQANHPVADKKVATF